MKKSLSIIVAILIISCVASFVTVAEDFTAPNYEPADLTEDVGIMLANNIDFEGVVGIQTTGEFTGAWRDAMLFELDPTTGAYKAIEFYASASTGPSWTIGENQFVVETNIGNDWPTLFEGAKGDEWYYSSSNKQGVAYKDCPNFINANQQAWDTVLKNIQIGSLYSLVGIDLDNPTVVSNYPIDENYYYITKEDYATYSYLTPYVEGSVIPGQESSEEETSEVETPSTGDSGIVALAVVSVISLAGIALIKKNKR